ncbi:MAG: hydroxyacid dehydrogenase [Candidatus Marinimicrobia bacterium]|nr:hydroxyacid dehydrogenase [Candidatus Neomarinimicrobiota bacterium]|tara:strand:+ start:917 stop:1849 length:933 start_codon:yes stop_codon:yes gene_type:complete
MKILYLGPKQGFETIQQNLSKNITIKNCLANRKILTNEIKDADGLIDASMKVPIDLKILKSSKKLKVISTATTGSDHIDIQSAESMGINVLTLKNDKDLLRNLTPAAELTWALLMNVARKVISASKHVNNGSWVRENFPGIMLKDKTLGIVGCGRIGQWISKYGNAFGMNVQGYDPFVKPWPNQIKRKSLEELFVSSDFITIHVHLTKDTRKLINSRLMGTIKPGAVLINTSRGGLIDEKALLKALISKRLSGAGLDVLDGEPNISNHPLVNYARKNDNLIITPHCGGFSLDALQLVCQRAFDKAVTYLD